MHNTTLQTKKLFLNVKTINLEIGKVSAPPSPFKKTCPAPYSRPYFYSDSPKIFIIVRNYEILTRCVEISFFSNFNIF